MSKKSARRVASFLLCWFAWTSLVLAQGPQGSEAQADPETSSEDAAPRTAVEWGHTGLRFFSEERWNDAIFAFEKAEAQAHSPVFLLYAARASQQTNRLLDAHRLYRKCAEETLTESSPLPWKNAVRDAQEELLKLEQELSGAQLGFSENWTMPLSVHLPDGPVTTRLPSMDVVLLPGQHVIEVEDPAGRRASQTWWARAGEYQVRIQFSPNRLSPNTQEEVAARRSAEWDVEPPARLTSTRRGAVVAWSVGGGFLVGAGVASGFAVSRAVELKKRCGDKKCEKEDKVLYDEALKNARLATAGLVVAGVAGAVGLTLWLLPPSEAGTSRLRADVGLDRVQFSGNF